MGKTQKRRKTDQRSEKRKQNKQGVKQQRTKKPKTVAENDQRSVNQVHEKSKTRSNGRQSYLLNEKVVELGGVEQSVTEIPEAELVETEHEIKQLPEVEKLEVRDLDAEDEAKKVVAPASCLATWWHWLHSLNVDYPWLKLVALMGVVILVVSGIGWALSVGAPLEGVGVSEGSGEGTLADDGAGGEKTAEDESGDEAPDMEVNVTEDPNAGQGTSQEPKTEVPAAPTRPAKEVTPGSKLIALTFDDGPSGATTPRLLDILAQKQVKVTFFVLGSMAQRAPDLVRREEAEGHEVGSHTPWHDNLVNLSGAAIREQVATMNQILGGILGHGAPFTRPPYGSVNQTVRDNLGQPLILWSVDPEDWRYRDAATVRRNVVGAAFDGAIILLHDVHASTVDAVAGIIDDLRAQGYEFLTISELAQTRGVTLLDGTSYFYFKP